MFIFTPSLDTLYKRGHSENTVSADFWLRNTTSTELKKWWRTMSLSDWTFWTWSSCGCLQLHSKHLEGLQVVCLHAPCYLTILLYAVLFMLVPNDLFCSYCCYSKSLSVFCPVSVRWHHVALCHFRSDCSFTFIYVSVRTRTSAVKHWEDLILTQLQCDVRNYNSITAVLSWGCANLLTCCK